MCVLSSKVKNGKYETKAKDLSYSARLNF
jgi:hypothetical protein